MYMYINSYTYTNYYSINVVLHSRPMHDTNSYITCILAEQPVPEVCEPLLQWHWQPGSSVISWCSQTQLNSWTVGP